MRRLLAAAGAAALGLAIVMPVAHAVVPNTQDQTLDWWTPVKYDQQGRANPQPSTAPDNATVFDTDEVVTAKVHFADGVQFWDVKIQPDNGAPASTCHENLAQDTGKKFPADVYISCPWDTTRVIDRTLDTPTPASAAGDQNLQRNWHISDKGPSVNGHYSIVVTAQSAGQQYCRLLQCWTPPAQQYELYQDANASRWRGVYVTNGISDPTGVNSTFDPGTNRINVTWARNPEPDVSYVVQEKVGDGQWSGGVPVPGTATNYVKAVDAPGKYQYQVQAVRPAPTDKNGSATKASKYVAASAVTVAQVAPPTTAGGVNGPDGSIDHSGDNGPLIPTDPTTTAPGTHVAGAVATAGHGGKTSGGKVTGGKATGPGGSSAGDSEAEGEGADDGYSAVLPFQSPEDSEDGLGAGDEEQPESMSKLVNVPKPQDARALLVPLAFSLAVFVLSMQLIVVIRRRPAMATVEDDFDDWMGY